VLNERVQIERIDPMDLDLDTAEELAATDRAAIEAAGSLVPGPIGPTKLKALQLNANGLPVAGLWVAREGGTMLGHAFTQLPVEDNTDSAYIRGTVHPEARRKGVGGALMTTALDFARAEGRERFYATALRGGPGGKALEAMGFSSEGLTVNAVRRVDVHDAPFGLWDDLYDEASTCASDYELVHLVGPTPDDMLDDMVTLHAAINDAPLGDPDDEEDYWDADRVRAYDNAMAGRRQTVYRVMARHRDTREWAGISMLCVDEFLPTIGFQEDTSVVRAHRGHRLGLLMKADMLRWISRERPEVAATDTWNATTNHHMIAVNERLGARVIAHYESYRLREDTAHDGR
jgi:GNAT superfamily N-acetyltransferase